MRRNLLIVLVFLAGFVSGGYLFSKTISRSFLAVHACDSQCWRIKDLAGLLGSVGIQHAPRLLPFFEVESQHCVAVRHPDSDDPYHITYLPKRDVRNVLELTDQDVPYLLGCLALAREHAAKAGIKSYRLVTNGPGRQHVTYFHFHVIGE